MAAMAAVEKDSAKTNAVTARITFFVMQFILFLLYFIGISFNARPFSQAFFIRIFTSFSYCKTFLRPPFSFTTAHAEKENNA